MVSLGTVRVENYSSTARTDTVTTVIPIPRSLLLWRARGTNPNEFTDFTLTAVAADLTGAVNARVQWHTFGAPWESPMIDPDGPRYRKYLRIMFQCGIAAFGVKNVEILLNESPVTATAFALHADVATYLPRAAISIDLSGYTSRDVNFGSLVRGHIPAFNQGKCRMCFDLSDFTQAGIPALSHIIDAPTGGTGGNNGLAVAVVRRYRFVTRGFDPDGLNSDFAQRWWGQLDLEVASGSRIVKYYLRYGNSHIERDSDPNRKYGNNKVHLYHSVPAANGIPIWGPEPIPIDTTGGLSDAEHGIFLTINGVESFVRHSNAKVEATTKSTVSVTNDRARYWLLNPNGTYDGNGIRVTRQWSFIDGNSQALRGALVFTQGSPSGDETASIAAERNEQLWSMSTRWHATQAFGFFNLLETYPSNRPESTIPPDIDTDRNYVKSIDDWNYEGFTIEDVARAGGRGDMIVGGLSGGSLPWAGGPRWGYEGAYYSHQAGGQGSHPEFGYAQKLWQWACTAQPRMRAVQYVMDVQLCRYIFYKESNPDNNIHGFKMDVRNHAANPNDRYTDVFMFDGRPVTTSNNSPTTGADLFGQLYNIGDFQAPGNLTGFSIEHCTMGTWCHYVMLTGDWLILDGLLDYTQVVLAQLQSPSLGGARFNDSDSFVSGRGMGRSLLVYYDIWDILATGTYDNNPRPEYDRDTFIDYRATNPVRTGVGELFYRPYRRVLDILDRSLVRSTDPRVPDFWYMEPDTQYGGRDCSHSVRASDLFYWSCWMENICSIALYAVVLATNDQHVRDLYHRATISLAKYTFALTDVPFAQARGSSTNCPNAGNAYNAEYPIIRGFRNRPVFGPNLYLLEEISLGVPNAIPARRDVYPAIADRTQWDSWSSIEFDSESLGQGAVTLILAWEIAEETNNTELLLYLRDIFAFFDLRITERRGFGNFWSLNPVDMYGVIPDYRRERIFTGGGGTVNLTLRSAESDREITQSYCDLTTDGGGTITYAELAETPIVDHMQTSVTVLTLDAEIGGPVFVNLGTITDHMSTAVSNLTLTIIPPPPIDNTERNKLIAQLTELRKYIVNLVGIPADIKTDLLNRLDQIVAELIAGSGPVPDSIIHRVDILYADLDALVFTDENRLRWIGILEDLLLELINYNRPDIQDIITDLISRVNAILISLRAGTGPVEPEIQDAIDRIYAEIDALPPRRPEDIPPSNKQRRGGPGNALSLSELPGGNRETVYSLGSYSGRIKITDTENLISEKTLLTHYILYATGEWIYDLGDCGYKPVCDEYWYIMYPNHQHPRHTDASPDQPLYVVTGSYYGTFAWNYGGIPGINPVDFDDQHSFLVQIAMVNQGCFHTGGFTGTGQSNNTGIGTTGFTGYYTPPSKGLPPGPPVIRTPGFGAPPNPQPHPSIPMVPPTGDPINHGTPELGWYIERPKDPVFGSITYINDPIFSTIPIKDEFIVNQGQYNPRPELGGSTTIIPINNIGVGNIVDNKNTTTRPGDQINTNFGITDKGLSSNIVFEKGNNNSKAISEGPIDILNKYGNGISFNVINRTADVPVGGSIDERLSYPNRELIPPNDSSKLGTNEAPAGLRGRSKIDRTISSTNTAVDTSASSIEIGDIQTQVYIVTSRPSIKKGEVLTISTNCIPVPGVELPIYGKIILVDSSSRQSELALGNLVIATHENPAQLAITIRTDTFSTGKAYVTCAFYDRSDNVIGINTISVEILEDHSESSVIDNYKLARHDTLSDDLVRISGIDLDNYVDFTLTNESKDFYITNISSVISFVVVSREPTRPDVKLHGAIYDAYLVESAWQNRNTNSQIVPDVVPAYKTEGPLQLNDSSILESDHLVGTRELGLVDIDMDGFSNAIVRVSKSNYISEPLKLRIYFNKTSPVRRVTRTSIVLNGEDNYIITFNVPFPDELYKLFINGRDKSLIPVNPTLYEATSDHIGVVVFTVPAGTYTDQVLTGVNLAPEYWVSVMSAPFSFSSVLHSDEYRASLAAAKNPNRGVGDSDIVKTIKSSNGVSNNLVFSKLIPGLLTPIDSKNTQINTNVSRGSATNLVINNSIGVGNSNNTNIGNLNVGRGTATNLVNNNKIGVGNSNTPINPNIGVGNSTNLINNSINPGLINNNINKGISPGLINNNINNGISPGLINNMNTNISHGIININNTSINHGIVNTDSVTYGNIIHSEQIP